MQFPCVFVQKLAQCDRAPGNTALQIMWSSADKHTKPSKTYKIFNHVLKLAVVFFIVPRGQSEERI